MRKKRLTCCAYICFEELLFCCCGWKPEMSSNLLTFTSYKLCRILGSSSRFIWGQCRSGKTALFSAAYLLSWQGSRNHNWWNIIKTNPQNRFMISFKCWLLPFQVTDISLLALNRTEDKNLPLPYPPLHLPRPRLNQRALVFALNLNELLLPAPWAVCISATGKPMRSGPTCYNNLFHLASHITHESIQSSISVWTFLSLTDQQA